MQMETIITLNKDKVYWPKRYLQSKKETYEGELHQEKLLFLPQHAEEETNFHLLLVGCMKQKIGEST